MSVYNLENQSVYNYHVKYRKAILDFSDREYINTYFLVGEKIDKKEQRFSLVMNELLCAENCELVNFINDTIQGRFIKKLKPLKLISDDENLVTVINNITQVTGTEMVWTNDTQW